MTRPQGHPRNRIPTLGGRRAVVLHREHANVTALLRQLVAIGLEAEEAWPTLPADVHDADFLFFDVDMVCDDQFPWQPGEAPMPLVAVIGSEAPGRIEWAMSHRADAHLVKPIGSAGIYSTLLIALQKFEERQALMAEVVQLRSQVAERRVVVSAVLQLMERGMSEEEAFSELRAEAMHRRVTLEFAARGIIQNRLQRRIG